MLRRTTYLASLLSLALVAACGDDGHGDGDNHEHDAGAGADAMPTVDEDAYSFDSRFVPGTSPVSKSGQAFRHVLIEEMKAYLGTLTASVDSNPPTAGQVKQALEFYFDFDSSTGGSVELQMASGANLLQATFDDVSTDKNLIDKLAGNDSSTDHKEWNTPGNFAGWQREGADTPTNLVRSWFQQLDDLAVERVASPQQGPDGSPVAHVYLTAEGHDLQQLTQKFLLGAVAFSQGADDYLSDDVEGKGLLASNLQDGDAPYSALGHAWDEGFGYFGASLNYHLYSDEERAGSGGREEFRGHNDIDGDGKIDLVSEKVLGNSSNCGKRDQGSADSAKTSYGDEAFAAFVEGRKLILSVDGELSDTQLDELRGYRDAAIANWEKCIAATVVHYINDVTADMEKFDTEDYDFATHAKHWGELKGFALGLQFNPASPMNEGTRFADFHAFVLDAPVLPTASSVDIEAYKAALRSARDLMQEAYGFADANVEAW